MNEQLILIILGSLASLGLLAGGLGYFISLFKTGNHQKQNDEYTLFNNQIDALKNVCEEQAKQIKTLQEDSKKHTLEIGRLNGIIESKDKSIAELNAIVQGKDPETKKFMEFVIQSCNDQQTVNAELIRVLGEIHSMARVEHERDFSVTSTVTKV